MWSTPYAVFWSKTPTPPTPCCQEQDTCGIPSAPSHPALGTVPTWPWTPVSPAQLLSKPLYRQWFCLAGKWASVCLRGIFSQLQVTLSGKQTQAPTVVAVGVAVNSHEQLTRQERLGCGIFFVSFCSAGLSEHTFKCICVYISKAAVCT